MTTPPNIDRDYVSPGLTVVRPDAAFPGMGAGDRQHHPWKYLRREVPHRWYVDARFPLMGFLNRDEVTLLHNVALRLAGRPALEIGGWLCWSTCHLALGGVIVDSIDPGYGDPELRPIVDASLAASGVADRILLHPGRSPQMVEELAATTGRKWSLLFIDGDHEAPAPLADARACLPYAAEDCAFVFHDLAAPAVAAGLRFLEAQGFHVLVYQTAQIMGIAWRGRFDPPLHIPDPDVPWQLPHHLIGLPVSGVTPDARGHVPGDRPGAPDLQRPPPVPGNAAGMHRDALRPRFPGDATVLHVDPPRAAAPAARWRLQASASGKTGRVGPVHVPSPESELAPVARYLTGRVLDATGLDDSTRRFLTARGATSIADLVPASSEPTAIPCASGSLPFVDGTFDSVLCGALLAREVDDLHVLRELSRVVRPGGSVVVTVPFVQQLEPGSATMRRHTPAGLTALGEAAGLEPVAVLPLHSIVQSLGTVLWDHVRSRGSSLLEALVWPLVFAATRIWDRPHPRISENALSFQVVFRRPDIIGTGWQQKALPPACTDVPAMLTLEERQLLHHLAQDYYTGAGCIVDAGSFLGGSTVALADGLRRNLERRGLPEEKRIHSFDRFEIQEYMLGTYFPESTSPGDTFRPLFDRNTAGYAGLIEVHAGDIGAHVWDGGGIEILHVDVASHWTVCDAITWRFFRHLIPGRSLVVQQDYLLDSYSAWIHITMEYYSDYFEYVCATEQYTVVFRCTRTIPEHVLRMRTVEDMDPAERIALMDRAASRFVGDRRALLLAAKKQYLDLMETRNPV